MNLRSRVIRAAHEHPELRSHLLPLLREASPVPPALKAAVADLEKTMRRRLEDPSRLTRRVGPDGVFLAIRAEQADGVTPLLAEVKVGPDGLATPMVNGRPLGGPMSPVDAWVKVYGVLRSWPGMKGSAGARKPPLPAPPTKEAIGAALQEACRPLGIEHEDVVISRNSVGTVYRTDGLPKEGVREVGEARYEKMVREEKKRAIDAVTYKLSGFKDMIDDIHVRVDPETWVQVTVYLKNL